VISDHGVQFGQGQVGCSKANREGNETAVILRPESPSGATFNELKLALAKNRKRRRPVPTLRHCCAVNHAPVTINGKMSAGAQFYRFQAKKRSALLS